MSGPVFNSSSSWNPKTIYGMFGFEHVVYLDVKLRVSIIYRPTNCKVIDH